MNTRRVLSSLQSPRGVLTAASASPLNTYTATKMGGNLVYGPADYTVPPVVPVNNTSAQAFATISTMPAMFRHTQDSATVAAMPAFRPTQDAAIVGAMPAVLCPPLGSHRSPLQFTKNLRSSYSRVRYCSQLYLPPPARRPRCQPCQPWECSGSSLRRRHSRTKQIDS